MKTYSRAIFTYFTKILADLRAVCLDRRKDLLLVIQQFLLLTAMLLVLAAASVVLQLPGISFLF